MKSILALSLMMTACAFANEQQEAVPNEQQVAAKKILVLEEEGALEEIAQAEAPTLEASE